MSWTSRLPSWSGRFSPFGRPSPNSSGVVSDSDFSYITAEDLARSRAGDGTASPEGSSGKSDVIVFRKGRVSYPVHFPSGSIDKGTLRVGEIRAQAARKMELPASDAARLKMVYKGQNLSDDSRVAKAVGLKSGTEAEVLCVMSDAPAQMPGDSEDDDDDDDLDSGLVDGATGGSKKKKRKSRKKKAKGKTSAPASGTATPTTHAEGLNPDATYIPTYTPPPRPASAAPRLPAVQQTAMEKLDALASHFHTKFVPECVQFTSNPPSDPAKRAFEHKKLEETMMQQILLKLDAVETEGDPDARAKRKALVKEVDRMMKSMDEVAKR